MRKKGSLQCNIKQLPRGDEAPLLTESTASKPGDSSYVK